MTPPGRFYNGILLVNKPLGHTSHDAVDEVRRMIQQRRVGHTGTLDPLAEGLLVLCLGRGTKIAQFLTDSTKVYEAEIYLGKKSETLDAEGIYLDQSPINPPDLTDTEAQDLLNKYLGRIKQQVPAFSAVRVDGARLYERARKGEEVDLPVREVEIKSIKLIEYNKPYLKFEVCCSKGTYIRSLAGDLGETLGCGAYLSGLKRTQVGKLKLKDALTFEQVQKCAEDDSLQQHLLSFDKVLSFESVVVGNEFADLIVSGRRLTPADILEVKGVFEAGQKIMLKDQTDRILAIGTAEVNADAMIKADADQLLFTYQRVLN